MLNQMAPLDKVNVQKLKRLQEVYTKNPGEPTDWDQYQAEYLRYYFPLNYFRSIRVLEETPKIDFIHKVLEIGSGVGNASLPWIQRFGPAEWTFLESSEAAQKKHQTILKHLGLFSKDQFKWLSSVPKNTTEFDLLFCSYALIELPTLPDWFWTIPNIVMIEPSTQSHGRKILDFREQALGRGYQVLAPCTHQGRCPLLHHSKKDWCHDRIYLDGPKWLLDLSQKLEIKNNNITLSYLVLTQADVAHPPSVRVVGDALIEKGRTRQLFCQNENYEFHQWLHRNHPPESPFDRGDLVDLATFENFIKNPKS